MKPRVFSISVLWFKVLEYFSFLTRIKQLFSHQFCFAFNRTTTKQNKIKKKNKPKNSLSKASTRNYVQKRDTRHSRLSFKVVHLWLFPDFWDRRRSYQIFRSRPLDPPSSGTASVFPVGNQDFRCGRGLFLFVRLGFSQGNRIYWPLLYTVHGALGTSPLLFIQSWQELL